MKRLRTSRCGKRSTGHNNSFSIESLEQRIVLQGDPRTHKLAINISPVNQAPFFTKGNDPTVLEDSGAQKVSHWATGISAGSKDEQKQTLKFVVTSDNPTLFSSAPRIDSDGTLRFTPAPNVNGLANINVRLMDSGGTANGGVDTSAPQTFVIHVAAVNDRPAFTKGKDQTVLEDSGPTTVTMWAKNIIPGPANESSQRVSFLMSSTNAALFSSPPIIAPDGTLSFVPAPNANGTAKVTVRLKDDGGTANHGVDTSDAQTFTITVKPVNDAPTFVKGQDQVVPKNIGLQKIKHWVTGVSPGPSNEKNQKTTFQVSTDRPSLFAVQPVISPEGTLVYMPAHNATGTATVSVRLKDTGGTKDGGHDTSAPQTFTISIGVPNSNQAPSFSKGPDQNVLEDSGPWTVANWATNIFDRTGERIEPDGHLFSNRRQTGAVFGATRDCTKWHINLHACAKRQRQRQRDCTVNG